jgi:hypothetical protein
MCRLTLRNSGGRKMQLDDDAAQYQIDYMLIAEECKSDTVHLLMRSPGGKL